MTDTTSATATPVSLPSNLSASEADALLGRLTDEQVRTLLAQELAARRDDAPEPSASLLDTARSVGEQLSANSRAVLEKWPQLGDAFGAVFDRLDAAGGIGFALFAFAVCVAVGFVARYLWRRRSTERQLELAVRNAETGAYASFSAIRDGMSFLLVDLSSAIAFGIAAMATLYIFFGNDDLRIFVSSYVAVITVILIMRSVTYTMFPTGWAIYRLVAISDSATTTLHVVILGLSGLWIFENMTTEVMTRLGAPEGTPILFSMLVSVVWVSSSLIGTWMLHRATADQLPGPDKTSFIDGLTRSWALLTGLFFLGTWVVFAGGGLLYGDVSFIEGALFKMMVLMLVFWWGYRVLVIYLRAQSMLEPIKGTIQRTTRAGLFAAGLVLTLHFWGLDNAVLEAGGLAGQAAQAVIQVLLTALIGWAIWDFVRTLVDVRIAAEQPDDDEEEAGDGEGGLGASRTATLLPLLRSTALAAIAVTCLLAAASSLGINIAPLLAGAGVLGLAVGFGAQTLVKDVVSGVFFLIDDAFRRGEYIDLGSVKGTVERISVRSLQLRHHLGAVHTIPFGDIAALTNYSRDWVIMKLPLRLTFDTDPQMVKKIIKRIGAELMEHEEFGRGLLEPPKSQGVIQMEDSAMILRVKFKAVPGKQFPIRRELLHRIRAAFEEAGIRFANREVTVRVNENATPAERNEAIRAAASQGTEAPQPAG